MLNLIFRHSFNQNSTYNCSLFVLGIRNYIQFIEKIIDEYSKRNVGFPSQIPKVLHWPFQLMEFIHLVLRWKYYESSVRSVANSLLDISQLATGNLITTHYSTVSPVNYITHIWIGLLLSMNCTSMLYRKRFIYGRIILKNCVGK